MKNVFLPILVLLLLATLTAHTYAQHGWPIDPMNIEHPIGNSFGELDQFYGYCLHTGVDILGTPRYTTDDNNDEDPTAPWVRVTVSGIVDEVFFDSADISEYHGLTTKDQMGRIYRYWHLDYGSFHSNFTVADNNQKQVTAGDQIAKLVRFDVNDDCEFHHLHYELQEGNNYLNPLAGLTPHRDTTLPEIGGIFVAEDNSISWIQFQEDPQRACTIVHGKADIIFKYRDRDNTGSTLRGTATLGVYNLRWRACPDSKPDCPWLNTRAFDNMDISWGPGGNKAVLKATSLYSIRQPFLSDLDPFHCNPDTWLYAIVTNFSQGEPDPVGNWDTTTVCDGNYTVSVKAIDFAGNETTPYSIKVCVQNGPRGPNCQDSPDSPKHLRTVDPN
jgi:hypothetical protein